MVTNGTVVMDALTYINGKAEKLSEMVEIRKNLDLDSEAEAEADNEEAKTTNDVF